MTDTGMVIQWVMILIGAAAAVGYYIGWKRGR